ncbi:MarR family winged helix-turn-helix transcriptional regulator [Ornithinimicrobium panacihumi]|uniref:MarR family winged helix-turn-helix transcriptional regulator n=1 Tax=Ornithinimicrobium panacihumi TaxID=2008449 RepID=UPI003F8AAFAD
MTQADAWASVAAFAAAVDASLDRWLTQTYRVGLTEYRALTHLSATPDKELRIAALAQRVGLTSTSTTRLVSRLEAKGFARRDLCQDDGRGVYAVIDAPGEDVLKAARGPYEDRVRELLTNASKHFPHLSAGVLSTTLGEVATLIKP